MSMPDPTDNPKPGAEFDGDVEWIDRTVRLPPGDNSLAGTMQQGRDLMFAELSGVDLTGADFYWAMFHDAVLAGAIMTRCSLRGATLNGANLRGADLTYADCGIDNLGGTTDFIKADLSGADLSNANIAGADFSNARLVDADLSNVRTACALPDRPLRRQCADLSGARLSGANLAGALYDDRTVFPKRFDPKRARMVHTGRKGRHGDKGND
jgi:uncharacterized protein YjbI with pentapeptide repeats